jgi:hypothetical protein
VTHVLHGIIRAWRWKVEIRPLENLLFYGALYAIAVWLPDGVVGPARSVLLVVITMLVTVLVALFTSAWRQRRKRRKARERGGTLPSRPVRGDEHIVQLSPGHEAPEVAAAFGLEIARRINKPGRKGAPQ